MSPHSHFRVENSQMANTIGRRDTVLLPRKMSTKRYGFTTKNTEIDGSMNNKFVQNNNFVNHQYLLKFYHTIESLLYIT